MSEPVNAGERVEALDVLRGVALFGVFLVNMIGFAGAGVMATEQQLLTLPSAPADYTVHELIEWLVVDKANTLFAFLFGLGFYLQMERLSARRADFERIYLRRLTALLVIGLIHNFFVWGWDILHLYALAGFVLFALRRMKDRALLVIGILLALLGRPAEELLVEFAGLTEWHGWPEPWADSAVLARQQVSEAGDYVGLVRVFAEFNWVDYILNGVLISLFLYVLGRFMLGAWVGRRGWLQHSAEHLSGFRRVLRVALPAGLVAEGLARIIGLYSEGGRLVEWDLWELMASLLHLLAVPVLAAGYLCAVVVAMHSPRWRRLVAPFSHVGRMALTNYVAQSLFIAFVLFGVGPGLSLAGRVGTGQLTLTVIAAFAAQLCFSRWWLARYRFGPLEWLWRAFTYGQIPALRIQSAH